MNVPVIPRLYDDLAYLWPILSPPEHYAAEAATLRALIAGHFMGSESAGRRLRVLELGAGGGHTLCHLANEFDCVAADISKPMLDNCKALMDSIPGAGVETVVGDMRDMRLGRTFDVVLVHDAIDYMTSEDDARRAIQTIREHLAPGGIAFVAPTYTRETFADGDVADDGTTTEAEELTYFSYVHDPDPADTLIEMILLYLIRDKATREVRVVEDRHACGLFSNEQWLGMIQKTGLQGELFEQEEGAWSLFIATHG